MATDEKRDLILTRSKLETGVEFFVEKIITKEVERIYISSDDEIEIEAVMLNIDEYEFLERRRKEYEVCKSLQASSAKDLLQEIKEDVEIIKKHVERLEK